MKTLVLGAIGLALMISQGSVARAQSAPRLPSLPNYDQRTASRPAAPMALRAPVPVSSVSLTAAQSEALEVLRQRVPTLTVDQDSIVKTPRLITAEQGFLTGRGGVGKALATGAVDSYSPSDKHRVIKAFVNEHAGLFGFAADALDSAEVKRDYVTSHNGLRTVVWQQKFQGIPVFAAVLQGHITRQEELVRLSSYFMPDLFAAASQGSPRWASLAASPAISVQEAVARAAQNLGDATTADTVSVRKPAEGESQKQLVRAQGLKGDVYAELTWLPMDGDSMRLCWKIQAVSQVQRETFRLLVDAETGSVVVRHNLTWYQSAPENTVSLSAYLSDSPTPFSPSWDSPSSEQPALVPYPEGARTKLTNFFALNAVASPFGWFYGSTGGVFQTVGNNVDAHADWDDDDLADIPRPRVPSSDPDFTFPIDLTQPPARYTNAAIVNLFYWNNFMHDRLYELGFTEAAGNFQTSNTNRGGYGGDAVQADAQDGAGLNDPISHANNANFSVNEDGIPGRMQMYVFNGPVPNRDGDLDSEIMCHEYTHGLSNRLVGGGVLIYALQTAGMGEGWSDFYPLCLLSEATDDPDACYAVGGYATYQFYDLTENYYYGIRRYPYTTDMSKNPLTFRDIDPAQADPHLDVPTSPVSGFEASMAAEVHNQGEVWCAALWEMRANLINAWGWADGNAIALQLVTDGMKLGPANPNFLEARDAIVQADEVDYGAANRAEIWIGFAKRGMGYSARCPESDTTTGVVEAYDLPPDVVISPPDGILEINVNPVNNATILGGSQSSVYVRVRDGTAVTNATVKGVLNGTTQVTFNNSGISPDSRARDPVYSGTMTVPTTGTNLTLVVTVSAPNKETAEVSVVYYIAIRPSNDRFANAIKVAAGGGTYVANNRFADAYLESYEPAHAAAASVTSSLWWSWTPTSNARALIDTGGSLFNTLLGVYTGGSLSSLTEVDSAQTLVLQRKAYVLLDAKKGETYRIAIASTSTNNAGQINLRIAPNASPDLTPPIVGVSVPVSGYIVTSNTVEVVATAYDPGPISSGVDHLNFKVSPINHRLQGPGSSGAEGDSTNRVALVEGRNTVSVSAVDGVGNTSDAVDIVVIYRRTPVANDHFSFATALTGTSGTASVNNTEATREPGEPTHAGNDGGHSVWWKWTAPEDGSLLLSTEGSGIDTLLGLYTGERVADLHTVTSNDDAFDNSAYSKLQQGVRSNQLYYIAVDSFNAATGVVQLAYSFAAGPLRVVELQATAGGHIADHDLGALDVPAGSTQTFTAVPDDGYEFAGWEGSHVSTSNPISLENITTDRVLKAVFRAVVYTDDFETGSLSHANWVNTGAKPWTATTSTAGAGTYSARTGAIGDSQSSVLKFTGKFAAGDVGFAFRVSSEADWDFFSFWLDGVQQFVVSGEVEWTEFSAPVAAGTHTFEWRYVKDSQNAGGLDAAFIDNFVAPVIPPVDSTSAPTLSIVRLPQGQFELRITGQTNQVYTLHSTVTLSKEQVGSTQRIPWKIVSTNVAAYGEVRIFLDPATMSQTQFYRALTR